MEGLLIWNPTEIAVGQCVSWKLGKLTVWAERYDREWHVLPVYSENETESDFETEVKADKPDSSNWRHYLFSGGNWAIPVPAMMDRPIVVRPDRVLVLLPGERARFFISIPIWFRLLVGKTSAAESGKQLFEFPIFPMSNAWFGDPISGELCYYSASRLYPDCDKISCSPVQAVCPLWISNESDKELSFDRICLHTEYLGIYRDRARLWTNEVSVVFRGADHATQILPSKGAPNIYGASKLVAEPRLVNENWYLKRTFDRLKYFTGF